MIDNPTAAHSIRFILQVLQTVWAKPFLYNAPIALTNLATSASASASSPPGPVTNIADLTRRQDKAEKLQAEKQIVENDNFHFDDDIDEDKNEASPSLFQKKLNKILAKIRFISTISTVVRGNNHSNEGSSDTQDNNPEEFEIDTKKTENTTPLISEQQTFQKVIYPNRNYGAPLKLNLKIGGDPGSTEITEEENVGDNASAGRIGHIGVFFAEILGSIVGLAYGAAAHLNNVIQAQNPKV
nr:uncharacterized protein LOC111504317 isoform X1 [Leptinotarsa decemlineata]